MGPEQGEGIGATIHHLEANHMGFKLAEIVNLPASLEAPEVCPTGKTAFATKAEAQKEAKRINRIQRGVMRAFRCDYCERYHLGHRR